MVKDRIGNMARDLSLAGYKALARLDGRIVAFSMHPLWKYATFYSLVGGNASPPSKSWPIYIRDDLFNPSWKEGSFLQIGIRKPHSMYFICVRKSDSDIWHELISH